MSDAFAYNATLPEGEKAFFYFINRQGQMYKAYEPLHSGDSRILTPHDNIDAHLAKSADGTDLIPTPLEKVQDIFLQRSRDYQDNPSEIRRAEEALAKRQAEAEKEAAKTAEAAETAETERMKAEADKEEADKREAEADAEAAEKKRKEAAEADEAEAARKQNEMDKEAVNAALPSSQEIPNPPNPPNPTPAPTPAPTGFAALQSRPIPGPIPGPGQQGV